jgi:Uma2 family endonuclease
MLPFPLLEHQELLGILLSKMAGRLLHKGEVIHQVDVFLQEEPPIIVQPDLLFVRQENKEIIKKDALRGVPFGLCFVAYLY